MERGAGVGEGAGKGRWGGGGRGGGGGAEKCGRGSGVERGGYMWWLMVGSLDIYSNQ